MSGKKKDCEKKEKDVDQEEMYKMPHEQMYHHSSKQQMCPMMHQCPMMIQCPMPMMKMPMQPAMGRNMNYSDWFDDWDESSEDSFYSSDEKYSPEEYYKHDHKKHQYPYFWPPYFPFYKK